MKVIRAIRQIKKSISGKIKNFSDESLMNSVVEIPTKFYKRAFAEEGTVSGVPDDSQIDGSVSYEEGWGEDYQRDLDGDPEALAIPRPESNQLMKDLTNALRQYQVFGVPNFIRSDQNAGFPYPYPKGAFCIFNDTINGPRIFQSLIADNVASPVDTSAWRWIDGTSTGVTQQNGAVFDSEVETGDIVYWNAGDGNYSRALANGGAAQTAIGIADLIYGRVVQFGFSDLFTALTPGSAYYLSSSLPGKITSTAVPGNAILMGVAITATSLNFNPQLGRNQIPAGTIVDWGGDSTNIPFGWAANDNSLYPIAGHPEAYAALGLRWGAAPAGFFRVPGKGSRVVIGAGQSAGLSAYVAGQVGGAEMAALLAVNNGSHAHQYNTKSGVAAQSGDSTLCWTGDAAATTGSSGSGTPFSILQPYIVFQSITKLQ